MYVGYSNVVIISQARLCLLAVVLRSNSGCGATIALCPSPSPLLSCSLCLSLRVLLAWRSASQGRSFGGVSSLAVLRRRLTTYSAHLHVPTTAVLLAAAEPQLFPAAASVHHTHASSTSSFIRIFLLHLHPHLLLSPLHPQPASMVHS
jgi:hypothetical protein